MTRPGASPLAVTSLRAPDLVAQAPDGAGSCSAVADRARGAVGLLKAALAALAEDAESREAREVGPSYSSSPA